MTPVRVLTAAALVAWALGTPPATAQHEPEPPPDTPPPVALAHPPPAPATPTPLGAPSRDERIRPIVDALRDTGAAPKRQEPQVKDLRSALRNPEKYLRFETTVEVHTPPPVDLRALGDSWWRHWQLGPQSGPPLTSVPSHAEMMTKMSGTLPKDLPQGVDLVTLFWYAMQALRSKATEERMPDIDAPARRERER